MESKIVCDACSKPELAKFYHLRNHNVDLCVSCYSHIESNQLPSSFGFKLLKAIMNGMDYTNHEKLQEGKVQNFTKK